MRSPSRYVPRIIILVLTFSSFTLAQNSQRLRELEQGKPIERELAGGDVHAYSILLTAGQFTSVIVDQRGIDVVATLFAPDGKQLLEVDSPNGMTGPEVVSYLAKISGAHRIEVRSLGKGAAAGRYEVKIETLRVATPEDKKAERIKAFAATLAAVKSEDEGLALLARGPELVTVELSKELNDLGRLQKAAQALITLRLALSVAEQIRYREGIARSLHNIGAAYHNQGNLKQAFECYQKSLPMIEELDDKGLLATLLVNMGAVNQAQGKPALALENFQKVLKLGEAARGTGVITAGFNIGNIYLNQGKYA